MSYLSKSPWVMHYNASSCNGCDIEVVACLTPLYDLERFGIINTGNPKHADILLITGSVNEKNIEVIQHLYDQMPDPKVIVALGICATSGGVFKDCYNIKGGVDKILPVDVYVPGCAVRPEAIIDGVVKSLAILEGKYKKMQAMIKGIEKLHIKIARPEDAKEILALQKVAYQSAAEIYNDYSLPPLTQSFDNLKSDFKKQTFYKAVMNNSIIGSVRAYRKNDTCYISRLIVHPVYQNLGIGTKLITRIEEYFSGVKRYEVFTWHKSKPNIFFYSKRNYKIFKTEKMNEKIDLVYMEKLNTEK